MSSSQGGGCDGYVIRSWPQSWCLIVSPAYTHILCTCCFCVCHVVTDFCFFWLISDQAPQTHIWVFPTHIHHRWVPPNLWSLLDLTLCCHSQIPLVWSFQSFCLSQSQVQIVLVWGSHLDDKSDKLTHMSVALMKLRGDVNQTHQRKKKELTSLAEYHSGLLPHDNPWTSSVPHSTTKTGSNIRGMSHLLPCSYLNFLASLPG